jgi:EAL and modified HD-GYP domain-containing signal transduction protein
MFASESSPFPLVGLKPVSNAQNQWVALALQPLQGAAPAALLPLLADPDAEALASLDCIIPLSDPLQLQPSHFDGIATGRVVLSIPAAACRDDAVLKRCSALSDAGLRLLVEGEAGIQASQAGVRGLNVDCSETLPSALAMLTFPGPHLARNAATAARQEECRIAGFTWFSCPPAATASELADDGTSRKRLLTLLGLLARDADSRELETLLKQDPALSYHLLKLVNSAAFAPNSNPIHNFGQAINVLGRRQLQRWLQLLLYARRQVDGPSNPLLPLAALRAAQMECLSKLLGEDRDAQDMAFLVGVFSLLDVLLDMPMTEVVAALSLDLDVVRALVERAGQLGAMLRLVEQHMPDASALSAVGIDNETYWFSLMTAYQWALQVSRNV